MFLEAHRNNFLNKNKYFLYIQQFEVTRCIDKPYIY